MANHCYNYERKKAVGIKKGVAWGTAVEPIELDGIFITGMTPGQNAFDMDDNQDESNRGMASQAHQYANQAQTHSMSGRVYQEGLHEYLIAFIMGAEAQTGTTIFTKTFSLLTCLTGLFSTIGYDEETQVKSLNSAILNALEFTISNGTLMWNAEFIGNKVDLQAGWDNPLELTYLSAGEASYKLRQLALWINDESGGALVIGDVLQVQDLTLRYQRGFVAPPPESGNSYLNEPSEENPPEITMSLTCHHKDATNRGFYDDYEAKTRKKASLVFTGETAGYSMSHFLPSFYFNEAPTYAYESPTQVVLSAKIMDTSALPTGMLDTTPYIETVSGDSTTYLT